MAVTNYPDEVGQYIILPLHVCRQITASVTAIFRFKMPAKATLIGVSASARASGGTTPTLTVDLLETGVSVLSAPIAVTAGAVAEGTITDKELADEAVMTVNLAVTGTTPTWDDITVQIDMLRHS